MRFKSLIAMSGLSLLVAGCAQAPLERPAITGLSHMAVYTAHPDTTDHFYRTVIGAVKLPDPENPQGVRYALSDSQYIEVLPLPDGAGINRLDHTAWRTSDAEKLRRYLAGHHWKTPDSVQNGSDGSLWFEVLDPEGNKVQFVQQPRHPQPVAAPDAIGHHMIHIGFLVHSRAAEDTFYRGLLGFRPYWFGGRKSGKLEWVSQQAPDGTDWLEYMLVDDQGTGIPPKMSKMVLAVLDHYSIGEVSVEDTFAKLKTSGRLKDVSSQHQPAYGEDGKVNVNLFEPDGVRVELMDLHATRKPCCSPFTASDPTK